MSGLNKCLLAEPETSRRAMLGLVAFGLTSGSLVQAVLTDVKGIKVGPPPRPSSGIPGTLNSGEQRELEKPYKERFYLQPLTPTESAKRAKESAQDIVNVKELLGTKAWPYVQNDLRLKAEYLRYDLNTVIAAKPKDDRKLLKELTGTLFDDISNLDHAAKIKSTPEAEIKIPNNNEEEKSKDIEQIANEIYIQTLKCITVETPPRSAKMEDALSEIYSTGDHSLRVINDLETKPEQNPDNKAKRGFQGNSGYRRDSGDKRGWMPSSLDKDINRHICEDVEAFTIFVDNLPEIVKKGELQRIYCRASEPADVFISFKKRSRTSKCLEFVRFWSKANSRFAIDNINGQCIRDQRLKLHWAE